MRTLTAPLVKLVVFLLVTGFATYALAATIANANFGRTTTYRAQFSDVTGLLAGDDVRIAGVRVGTVKSIKLVHHNVAQVSFTVTKERPLPESVVIRLKYRNLVGQRYMSIEQGAGSPVWQNPEQPIPTSHTYPALDLSALFGGFKHLFAGLNADEINQLSMEVIQTLQGEGGTIDTLLAHTASLTNALADKDQIIGELIDNLSTVLLTVGQRDAQFNQLIVQLQRWISGLAEDREQIGQSLDGINQLTGATAALLNETRPQIKVDVADLRKLAQKLNEHGADIDGVLQRLPNKVGTITRTASYGSWFNFFMCSAGGSITLPLLGEQTVSLPGSGNYARCGDQ
jgi:phospholipid/cholesterol/gamma-HCH transport system substrate-binding protein